MIHFSITPWNPLCQFPFTVSNTISESASCCSHSWSVSSKTSDKTFMFKIFSPKSNLALNFHGLAVGKEMVCYPSLIPLTLKFFPSFFNLKDASGYSRFGKLKMNKEDGLVLFSLNYSMTSVWKMSQMQISVKIWIQNNLLDHFIIKKDLVSVTFHLENLENECNRIQLRNEL